MDSGMWFGKAAGKRRSVLYASAALVFLTGCGGGGGNSGAGDYKLKVSVSPANSGTVEIEPLANSYPEWAKVEVAAKANKGFSFSGWSGEDASDSRNVTITMSGKKNKTLIANFKVIPTIKDSRDGKAYKTVKIGEQVWMGENLNYAAGGNKCYENSDDNCAKYGRLYNWNDARSACPSGWHLPSDEEWSTLESAVGGRETAGKKLKSTTGWNNNGNGTDEFEFAALPGGFGYSGGGFSSAGYNGYWWSAAENGANFAWFRSIGYINEGVGRNYDDESYLFSVRCVQD